MELKVELKMTRIIVEAVVSSSVSAHTVNTDPEGATDEDVHGTFRHSTPRVKGRHDF